MGLIRKAGKKKYGEGKPFSTLDRPAVNAYSPLCRDNKLACLLNGAIPPYAKYGLVHPMRGKDGEYPADFRHPKTVDTMRVLDSKF